MRWLLPVLLLLPISILCQDVQKVAFYEKAISMADSDEKKVEALGHLAAYYQLYRLDRKADSVLEQQILVAELSRNKDLLLEALFNPSIINIGSWTPMQTFDRATSFLQKSLHYAQNKGKSDYAALAYIRLAGISRKRGKYEEAQKQVSLAYATLGGKRNDSLNLLLHLEWGDIYSALGDALPAFNNYSTALDISFDISNTRLRSEIYHHLADLYRLLHDDEAAKEYLQKSMSLNESTHNTEGLIMDYIDLARFTDEKEYIEKAAQLAGSIQSEKFRLYAKRLMLSWLMVKGGNAKISKSYLDDNEDLVQYFKNQGLENYFWTLGHIYRFSNNYDSSIYCFKCAEVQLEKSYDDYTKLQIYKSLGETYLAKKDSVNATLYFGKAYKLAKEKNLPASLPNITETLSYLEAAAGNYEKAFDLSLESMKYKKEFEDKAAKDKLALLALENEEKEKEYENNRRHNLQYMGITMAIAIIFLVLLFAGMFPVNQLAIKIFGFLSFVSLFEFIILLIDKFLHEITHGEPIKIWLCKVVIIALLVPFQHFLEHKMVHYLASRKLVFIRKKLFLGGKNKKDKAELPNEENQRAQNSPAPTAVKE